jgi:hypothetical protein
MPEFRRFIPFQLALANHIPGLHLSNYFNHNQITDR